MTRAATNRRPDGTRLPGFRWQAVLIVLPLVVLTVVGLLSLRQDRLLAREEARERASRMALELAERQRSAMLAVLELRTQPSGVGLSLPSRFETDSDLAEQRLREVLKTPQPRKTSALVRAMSPPRFRIDLDLQLVQPPVVEPIPAPEPLNVAALPETSRDLWNKATQAESVGDPAAASAALRDFLTASPPEPFAAVALYRSAILAKRLSDAAAQVELSAANSLIGESSIFRAEEIRLRGDEAASVTLGRLLKEHPMSHGDSGLPLGPLVQWHRLQLAQSHQERVDELATLCSNLVHHPTPLSDLLLSKAAAFAASYRQDSPVKVLLMGETPFSIRQQERRELEMVVNHWRRSWDWEDQARRIYRATLKAWKRHGAVGTAAGHEAAPLAPLWVRVDGSEPPDEWWLVVRAAETNLSFAGLSTESLQAVWKDQADELPGAPAYLAFTLEIGGRSITPPSPHPVLAEAAARSPGSTPDPLPPILVRAHLSDPQALLARQRQRSWWFAGLVLTSSAAAGLGLRQAYRAFGRQLRLNELKSNFVSSVSHELRAPIASMRLLAENLESDKVPAARQRDYFRLIVQECRRLSSLIENVLDFSRIDQGRKQYEFEPTDLSALVNQTVLLMEPYAAERQVRLDREVPEHCQLVADGRALQQALVNLLDNALKHSPAQSAITVSLQALATGAVRLVVADHGPGIPAGEQERIFEPFYRRGSELRRETAGVGIGLTIVRHIVTAHQGRVWVESTLGEGSRFIIEVPATTATEALA